MRNILRAIILLTAGVILGKDIIEFNSIIMLFSGIAIIVSLNMFFEIACVIYDDNKYERVLKDFKNSFNNR
ncbi:MAG: hypothetical protein ACRCX2_00755 [Paraclostridium sp.]